MASLLDFLGRAATAGVGAESARLEGRMAGEDRAQKNLLIRLKQEQDAAEQQRAAQMFDLQRKNIEDQIRARNAPPPPPAPVYDRERGVIVNPSDATARPVQGLPADTLGSYEERPEKGGVAIYENGKFKSWKLRPPTEREQSPVALELQAQRLFNREQSLADDFRQEQEVKDAKGIAGAVATIRGSLSQNTPQSDLAAIYALVKLYDPGSVVREGEIALTQSASSLPQRVRLLWQGWNSGRKLLPEQREAIQDIADGIVAERQAQVNPVLQRYGRRASQWGVDSASVAPNPFDSVKPRVVKKYDLEVPGFPGGTP